MARPCRGGRRGFKPFPDTLYPFLFWGGIYPGICGYSRVFDTAHDIKNKTDLLASAVTLAAASFQLPALVALVLLAHRKMTESAVAATGGGAKQKKPSGSMPNSKPLGNGPFTLGDFELGPTLGTGSFGRVRFCTHKEKGSHWAIKMLKKSEILRLHQLEHMVNETSILGKLTHGFIVKLAGTFQDDRSLYMILEYVCGEQLLLLLLPATAALTSY